MVLRGTIRSTLTGRIHRTDTQRRLTEHLNKIEGQQEKLKNILAEREEKYGEVSNQVSRIANRAELRSTGKDDDTRKEMAYRALLQKRPELGTPEATADRVSDNDMLIRASSEHAHSLRRLSHMRAAVKHAPVEVAGRVDELIERSLGNDGLFSQAAATPSLDPKDEERFHEYMKNLLDRLKDGMEKMFDLLRNILGKLAGYDKEEAPVPK